MAVSAGSTLVFAESHLETLPDGLWFSNRYDWSVPQAVDVEGTFLPPSRIPVLGATATAIAVACGNHSLLHPALDAVSECGSRVRRITRTGLWGGYPDHEFAHTAKTFLMTKPGRVEVRSLLYGGYRQSVDRDDDLVPRRITVEFEAISLDLRRVVRRRTS